MLTAISRYGARVIPNTEQTIAAMKRAGTYVQGPHIAEFEDALARRIGVPRSTTASYGRMAFWYILRALDLPPGSEIIFPALTFWVVPEMARVAGYRPVFADVNPDDFTIDLESAERLVTERTRAIVPTHLYGLTCDMDGVERLAATHGLRVIEDCAHALGSSYRGRAAGTFGDAAFFSFQTLKPLNTYGGGAAVARDPAVAARIAELATSERWPTEARLDSRLRLGRLQRVFIRPPVFTWTAFPILWASSWTRATPDVYLWEKIRPLNPMPESYTERYGNVQAAIGLEALRYLDEWTLASRAHARRMDAAFAAVPGVRIPPVPDGREHVYYQYCLHVPHRDELVRRCVRSGVDVETLHVDVCTRLRLFGPHPAAPGAEHAADAVQLPVYASLSDAEVSRVITVVRASLDSAPQLVDAEAGS
ncbi:MAG: DegT/DnrJ/EryC1/StrS aminotransferase family protein [Vicinamibacterales bacterium]